MEFYKRLEHTLSWNKSVSEQTEELSQFDNISEAEIQELLKCFKWFEAGILIEYLGVEKLEGYLPELLEFLQDGNWPASGGATNLLRKSGMKIIPEIKRVFNEIKGDSIWHYWILVGILRHWDKRLIEELKPELLRLVKMADKEGASIEALKILHEENLIDESELLEKFNYLKNEFADNDYWLTELKEEIKPVANNK